MKGQAQKALVALLLWAALPCAGQFLVTTGAGGSTSINAGVTTYTPWGGYLGVNATESRIQQTLRSAGTIANLSTYISANSLSGTHTIRLRKNTANGNLVVSISAAATGFFEDLANSDAITAGDIVNLSHVAASGSGTITERSVPTTFISTSQFATRLIVSRPDGGRNFSTASVDRYLYLQSAVEAGNATESTAQQKILITVTLNNLCVQVPANARTTTTEIRSRKNTADGALVVSITSTATGTFEDTANSDSLVSGDLSNWVVRTGTGTGNFSLGVVSADFNDATTKKSHYFLGDGYAFNPAVTSYMAIGSILGQDTTESFYQVRSRGTPTISNLALHVSANSLTAATTFTFRKNTADGNQTLSVGSAATGYFEDSTNTDVLADTDLINLKMITGSTGTTITPDVAAVVVTFPSGAAAAFPAAILNNPIVLP